MLQYLQCAEILKITWVITLYNLIPVAPPPPQSLALLIMILFKKKNRESSPEIFKN